MRPCSNVSSAVCVRTRAGWSPVNGSRHLRWPRREPPGVVVRSGKMFGRFLSKTRLQPGGRPPAPKNGPGQDSHQPENRNDERDQRQQQDHEGCFPDGAIDPRVCEAEPEPGVSKGMEIQEEQGEPDREKTTTAAARPPKTRRCRYVAVRRAAMASSRRMIGSRITG